MHTMQAFVRLFKMRMANAARIHIDGLFVTFEINSQMKFRIVLRSKYALCDRWLLILSCPIRTVAVKAR